MHPFSPSLISNIHSGKSESITIKNEKGRLSQEEIERMVAEAERFQADDEAQRKRIEALNSLSSFIYGLKSQLSDQDGLGGKLSEDDKKSILNTIKETTEWIDENGSNASTEDLEEKLAGTYSAYDIRPYQLIILSPEVQGVVNPITSKLYSSDAPRSSSDDDEILRDHDEL